MKKEITKKLGVAMVIGMLSFTSVAYAKESAEGVLEYTTKSYETSKQALEQLQAGDKTAAADSLRNLKQYTKEITGAAAGIDLEKANKAIRSATDALDDNNIPKATESTGKAVDLLTKIYNKTTGK